MRALRAWTRWHQEPAWRASAVAMVWLACGVKDASAATHTLTAAMTGGQEIPPAATGGTGTCTLAIDDVTGNATFTGAFSGLTSPATAAGVHGLVAEGASGPALLTQTSVTASASGTFSGSGTLTAAQIVGVLAGEGYCEIDDARFPGGELRGQLFVPSTIPLPAATAYGGIVLFALLAFTGMSAVSRRGGVHSW